MKNYVGARSVQCNCIFCRQCLIDRGILYRYGSEIGMAEAKRDNLRCAGCSVILYTQKLSKFMTLKQKTEKSKNSNSSIV
jgi:hypothetical protein